VNRPRVTVVVCSLNGARTIGATLDALGAQTVAIDVLVVDDGSTDDTASIATRKRARVVRHERNQGLAAARNTGWRAAGTPLVAFTDDDCRPATDWVEQLADAYVRYPGAAGVGGAVEGSSEATFILRYLKRSMPLAPLEAELLDDDALTHRLVLYLRHCTTRSRPVGERLVSSFVGANMLFPTDVLAHADGFDPRFRFGGEEEDLCRRLVKDGQQLVFIPDARVQHDFEPGLADTLRRSRAYGRGNARIFLKHAGVRPTVYPLPAVVGGLLAFAALRRNAAVAGAAAVLPSVLFSRWLGEAARTRDPELLVYPYVALAQEACGNVGLLQEMRRSRLMFRDARVAP
jgi:glycosyltransferase involved in cell wall biosynthesis